MATDNLVLCPGTGNWNPESDRLLFPPPFCWFIGLTPIVLCYTPISFFTLRYQCLQWMSTASNFKRLVAREVRFTTKNKAPDMTGAR